MFLIVVNCDFAVITLLVNVVKDDTKLRYKTTAKTVYDQPCSTSDQKDRDQSKFIKI